ncbi:MAG: alpha/beta fold hydrolase [Victivallaceae bacterium]|nr:alpha/beta fold hydrolase [Victivallaceae bacterium]
MLGLLEKYFRGKRCHFYLSPSPENDRHEIVVLIHGLIRRSYAMYPLGKYLCRHGFAVYIYDYQTSTKSISAHGDDLRRYLTKIMAENPELPLNIVTHSMGGILTRYALAENDGAENPALAAGRVKRIVMLAPPHRGSGVARRLAKHLPIIGKWLKPLAELSNGQESAIHSVPFITGPEIGIIAAKYDQQVALEATYLPGMKEHCVMKAEHCFMVYLKRIHAAVLRFLTTGTFR